MSHGWWQGFLNRGRRKAGKLYYAARAVADSIGAWQPDDELKLDEDLTPCRLALSETEFESATEEGRAMTMAQAIAHALRDSEPDL